MASEKTSMSETAVASSPPQTPTQGINRTWSMGSYPKLSTFMASWPDVAIFRRFGALNAQNLLFLQAEICHLERELEVIRNRDILNNDEKGNLAQRNWFELSNKTDDGEPCEQWLVIQDIRDKLKEYNKCLLEYKDLCALQNPSKHDFQTLREWLRRPECGDNFLEGVERDFIPHENEHMDTIDQERVSDLITVSREAVERDFFSRWLTDEVLGPFHKLIGHRFKVSRASECSTGSKYCSHEYRNHSTKRPASITTASLDFEPSLISSVSSWPPAFQQRPSSPSITSTAWLTDWA